MSIESVIAILLAFLAGGGAFWALFRKRETGKTDPYIAAPKSTTDDVVEAGIDAVNEHLEDAVSDTEAVEDSDTPATDAAALANARARREEDPE